MNHRLHLYAARHRSFSMGSWLGFLSGCAAWLFAGVCAHQGSIAAVPAAVAGVLLWWAGARAERCAGWWAERYWEELSYLRRENGHDDFQ